MNPDDFAPFPRPIADPDARRLIDETMRSLAELEMWCYADTNGATEGGTHETESRRPPGNLQAVAAMNRIKASMRTTIRRAQRELSRLEHPAPRMDPETRARLAEFAEQHGREKRERAQAAVPLEGPARRLAAAIERGNIITAQGETAQ